MASVLDSVTLHEKAVQAVAVENPRPPRKQRAKETRARTSTTKVLRVERALWEEVKKVIRPGEFIVIVSEHEVWLTNKR